MYCRGNTSFHTLKSPLQVWICCWKLMQNSNNNNCWSLGIYIRVYLCKCIWLTLYILLISSTEKLKKYVKRCNIHPGGIKVGLNIGLGTFAELQDLSVCCKDRQQSQGNHLDGLHLISTTCRGNKTKQPRHSAAHQRSHFRLEWKKKSQSKIDMWRERVMAAVFSPVCNQLCMRDSQILGVFIDLCTCSFTIDHILGPSYVWAWELAPVQMNTLFKQASFDDVICSLYINPCHSFILLKFIFFSRRKSGKKNSII